MLFDSHAHLNFAEFAQEWETVIADCQKNNIWLINIGSQLATSKKGIAIAQRYEQGVYAAVGLHPIHVEGSSSYPELFDPAVYGALIETSPKVVAVGETGIDFFHDDSNFEKQAEVFTQHIELAKKFDKAVVIHGRNSRDGKKNAYREILNIVKREKVTRAVVHCFGGNLEEAEAFADLGLFIGFTGIITFKNATELATIAKQIPLEQILIETDCPYLAPEPFRGKRNQPQYVSYVAEKISQIKEHSIEVVANQTAKNAKKFYRV